jgi:anti-sigma regulatory factor (Ser/Thr protein kinase)
MSDTLRLEHGIHAPGHARRWLVQRCHEWQCDALADSAALLITELVTNVFLHARTDCLIEAEFDRSVLVVTVTDWDSHDLSVRPTSATAESGRGLAILEAVADDWGTRKADGTAHPDHGKSVWFRLVDRPPAAAPTEGE